MNFLRFVAQKLDGRWTFKMTADFCAVYSGTAECPKIWKGPFNEYVDQVLSLFDPLPHLVHIVIEWPQRDFILVLSSKNIFSVVDSAIWMTELQFHERLMIVWRLTDDCLTTAWQLHDNCMTTAWQLHENCLMTAEKKIILNLDLLKCLH